MKFYYVICMSRVTKKRIKGFVEESLLDEIMSKVAPDKYLEFVCTELDGPFDEIKDKDFLKGKNLITKEEF